MSVVAVLPTLLGREESCDRTVAAYKDQGAGVLLVKGASTCGEGWAAGLAKADADFIILGVDDAVPHEGTVEAGVKAAENGIFPSPRMVLANGELESCGTLGGGGCHLSECPTGTLAYMSSIPIATKAKWDEIGPPLPIHYYSDDYLGYMARRAGLDCQVVREYAFTHYDEQFARPHVVARAMEDRSRFVQAVSEVANR